MQGLWGEHNNRFVRISGPNFTFYKPYKLGTKRYLTQINLARILMAPFQIHSGLKYHVYLSWKICLLTITCYQKGIYCGTCTISTRLYQRKMRERFSNYCIRLVSLSKFKSIDSNFTMVSENARLAFQQLRPDVTLSCLNGPIPN